MQQSFLPLMSDNITREDADAVIRFLSDNPLPRLSNGPKVLEFEKEFSNWLGVKYSIVVNSGSSANQITMLGLKNKFPDGGEIIVPPLTWVSDWASVLQNGFTPKTCDINFNNLSFDIDKLKSIISDKTIAIFITHVLGLNALTDELVNLCKEKNILLIEDVCESVGATFKGRKVGTFGFASNWSGYIAHHFSAIEMGIVSTNDYEFYQFLRAARSHGMLREMTDDKIKNKILLENQELNSDFVFIAPAYNFRSTEINAVLGLSQLKRLDSNNDKRIANFEYFVQNLRNDIYFTDFFMYGQCNYAFIVILKKANMHNRNLVEKTLKEYGIEFRRGLSGGGSQLRQPYLKGKYEWRREEFPVAEFISDFSWYVGNYPTLEKHKIDFLLRTLNSIDCQ